jgi:hypothetical protein
VPTYEDNRQMHVCFYKIFLKLKSASSGQPDVQHKTPWPIQMRTGQKVLNRSEQIGLNADGLKKISQGFTHFLIVIDNDNDWPNVSIR